MCLMLTLLSLKVLVIWVKWEGSGYYAVKKSTAYLRYFFLRLRLIWESKKLTMVENATAYSLILLYCPFQNGYDQSALDPPLSQA